MSKTYGMAGWRIGFVLGNAEIVERVNLLGDHSRVGIFAPLQQAAIAALDGPQDSVEERRAAYERRRDRLAAALPEPPVCEGTFYVWLRLPDGLTPERLLAEHRVAVAPGEGFGPSGAGWARLSLAVTDEVLERGHRAARARARGGLRMKIGIVVPFSWSYWGGVVEHAENQASALRARGHDVQILMGHDPPGVTDPPAPPADRPSRRPAAGIIPVGRSVVVPANGSLPNIVLSPRAIARVRDVLARAAVRPPPPARADDAGDLRRRARVREVPGRRQPGTRPATSAWMRAGLKAWGFLADRIDARIAVSRMAAESAERWLGPGFEIVPNGVVVPEHADAGGREHQIVFIGRHDARKGLPVLLRGVARRSGARRGARLRLIGTDPLQYRLLHSRMRFDEDGIDVLGIVTNEVRARELAAAKIFVSPALGGESFGMVLVEAFATATPVVASNIPGLRRRRRARRRDARRRRATRARSRRRSSACSPTRSGGSRWAAPAALSPRSATPGPTSRGGSRRSTSGSSA